MELKKFSVKKSEWLRGEGGQRSYLLRSSDNKMCCLGFASLACGFSKEDIKDKQRPADVSCHDNIKYPDYFFNFYSCHRTSASIDELMIINDDSSLNDDDRISRLTEKFKNLGIQVTFED